MAATEVATELETPDSRLATLTENSRPLRADDPQVEDLRSRLRGDLLRPGDTGYEESREVWNGMIDRKPGLIARCRGVADVRAAVDLARDHRLRLSVRGGGHNIAGSAVCDGGLMIDLSPMDGIRVDPRRRTARVGPGCTWGEVDRETQPFGLAVPNGIVSTTGVAGLTLGGGFGWLTRKYGFTSDHLRSVDVVTADGAFRTVDEDHEPDLFWALRGGSGNFGVVTSFDFQLRPVGPEVWAGLVLHPMERAAEVARLFREVTSEAPDELTCLLVLRTAPPAPFLPEEVHGEPVAGIAVCHCGALENGERAVEPVRSLDAPLADVIGRKPFTAHQTMLDASNPPGRHYYWKSHDLDRLDDAALSTLVEGAAELPSPESVVLLMHLGGAAARVEPTATAAAHRRAPYILNIAAAWEPSASGERPRAWARGLWEAMQPHAADSSYVNFLTEDEGRERVQAAYGVNYQRLVEIKRRWDPDNLFRSNQNIRP